MQYKGWKYMHSLFVKSGGEKTTTVDVGNSLIGALDGKATLKNMWTATEYNGVTAHCIIY